MVAILLDLDGLFLGCRIGWFWVHQTLIKRLNLHINVNIVGGLLLISFLRYESPVLVLVLSHPSVIHQCVFVYHLLPISPCQRFLDVLEFSFVYLGLPLECTPLMLDHIELDDLAGNLLTLQRVDLR